MTRTGHSLVELIVAMTVLGVGLASTGAASVYALRQSSDALLKERAVAVGVATLDSLTLSPAPADGAVRRPDLDVRWVVQAAPRGGTITLQVSPAGAPRWVRQFRARYLAPVPALPPGPGPAPPP